MANKKKLNQKLIDLSMASMQAIDMVRMAQQGEETPTFGRTEWSQALQAVAALEQAVRKVRSYTRARFTKRVRESCGHGDQNIIEYYNGHKCRACGQKFKGHRTLGIGI